MANSKKRCRNCKKYKPSDDMLHLNGGNYCNIECATSYGFKNKEKGKKIKHNQEKKKFKLSDRKIRLPAAQKAFNAYIRERDKSDPCISCGEYVTVDMPFGRYDCGHYKTVGGFPELRFEELNAHKQCKSCNGGSGNFSKKDTTVSKEYRINLIKKIGLDKVEWLEGPHEPKKYSCDDLLKIEKYYKQKLKDLIQ